VAVGSGNIQTGSAAEDSGNLQQHPAPGMHLQSRRSVEERLWKAPRRLSPPLLFSAPSLSRPARGKKYRNEREGVS